LPQGLILAIECGLIILNVWSMVVYTKQYLPYLRESVK